MSRIRSKWGILVAGSALLTLQIGQCLGDFLEDIIVFNWVN
jgi:hypothetical protein